MTNRLSRHAGTAIACTLALMLTACAGPSPDSRTPEMDKTAVAATIEELPGVNSAEVGAYSTGTPGDYGLRVEVTVDEAGYAALGDVVTRAVGTVAASPGDYRAYDFEVAAPDPEGSGDVVILTLGDYRDEIDLPVGTYLGSTLSLTSDELRQLSESD